MRRGRGCTTPHPQARVDPGETRKGIVPVTASSAEVRVAVAEASASETARIVSTLIRITGDWDLAEDCIQDAFAKALTDWLTHGIPGRPGAWLTTVAKNRAIDQLRRAASEHRAIRSLGIARELEQIGDQGVDRESDAHDRLSLIFACCHPALSMDARVALTLRTVGGLSVSEIARAFLVSESTMDKRLVRARAKIKNAGIPFRVPPLETWPERLTGVLAVLYLLFNEGYSSTEKKQWVRVPIADEAIRLQRMLVDSVGHTGFASEAESLLALMLFQHARRRARITPAGDLITLENQERTLWDQVVIREAVGVINDVSRRLTSTGASPGPYFLQASIAGCHATASSVERTDFVRIATLYEVLATSFPSPVVDLNYAVAVSMAEGPAAGLVLVEALDRAGRLGQYYLLPATRADLLRRLGRFDEALYHYHCALDLSVSPTERRYLRARITEMGP